MNCLLILPMRQGVSTLLTKDAFTNSFDKITYYYYVNHAYVDAKKERIMFSYRYTNYMDDSDGETQRHLANHVEAFELMTFEHFCNK